MSWLDDVLRRGRPVVPSGHPLAEVETVTVQRPGWAATTTGLLRTIDAAKGRQRDPLKWPTVAGSAEEPLPQRRDGADGQWLTSLGERVGIGDLIAFRHAEGHDAMGRIVARAEDGSPECVLGDVEDDPLMPRPRLRVEESRLSALLSEPKETNGGEAI